MSRSERRDALLTSVEHRQRLEDEADRQRGGVRRVHPAHLRRSGGTNRTRAAQARPDPRRGCPRVPASTSEHQARARRGQRAAHGTSSGWWTTSVAGHYATARRGRRAPSGGGTEEATRDFVLPAFEIRDEGEGRLVRYEARHPVPGAVGRYGHRGPGRPSAWRRIRGRFRAPCGT